MNIDLAKVLPLLLAAFADGKLDATEMASIIAVLATGALKPPVSPPVPVPAPPPVVVAPRPPQPTAPVTPAGPEVASLSVNLDLFLAEGVPCPYKVEETADFYQIVKTDGTSNLPIHGGAYLHAGYLDAQGVGIMFPPGSPMDHTAIWTATRVSDGTTVFCGPGNPANEGGDRDVANFRLEEYERTRGMDVPVHFPPAADNQIVEATLSAFGLKAKPVRFPKIS